MSRRSVLLLLLGPPSSSLLGPLSLEDISFFELRTVFKVYGEVTGIKILTDESSGEPTGNAVVFYRSRDSAMDAITKLHQAYKIREGDQHPISVSWAMRCRGPFLSLSRTGPTRLNALLAPPLPPPRPDHPAPPPPKKKKNQRLVDNPAAAAINVFHVFVGLPVAIKVSSAIQSLGRIHCAPRGWRILHDETVMLYAIKLSSTAQQTAGGLKTELARNIIGDARDSDVCLYGSLDGSPLCADSPDGAVGQVGDDLLLRGGECFLAMVSVGTVCSSR